MSREQLFVSQAGSGASLAHGKRDPRSSLILAMRRVLRGMWGGEL
jgi:hypothetical protein